MMDGWWEVAWLAMMGGGGGGGKHNSSWSGREKQEEGVA